MAFWGCSSLKSIVIPEGVISIDYGAFDGCESLTSIVIPDSVTNIGNSAFHGCSSLKSIVIPDSVTSIGCSAFSGCSSLKSIVIPEGVISIDWGAFSGCSSLKSIVIPDSVTSIGDHAFDGCSSLTSIVIPDSVTSIGRHAFSDTNLTQEENGVRYVGKWVVGCDSSLKHAQLRNNTVGIAHNTFASCRSLTGIIIPDSITSIGGYAFEGCSAIENIIVEQGNPIYHSAGNCLIETKSKTLIAGCKNSVIPDDGSVTSIDVQAFYRCDSLTSIIIPKSVTSIVDGAFSGCNKLESITVEQGNPIYHSAGNCVIEPKSKTLKVGCKNSVIPDDGSVTSIGDKAFYNCSSLKSIVIPDSVTSIGDEAFYNCSSLTNISIPDSVICIGIRAFYNCDSFTSIEIPDSVTGIGWAAFSGCSSLTYIVIPNSITSIGDYAFYDCSSLKTIKYIGTEEQWKAVKKGGDWKSEDTQVICTGKYSGNSKSI